MVALGPEAEELQQARAKFASLDRDGNSILTFKEMSSLLRMGNPELSDRELRGLFRNLDTGKNGKVEFDDFARMLLADPAGAPACTATVIQMPMPEGMDRTLAPDSEELQQVRAKFAALDRDGNCVLTFQEMSSLLRMGNPDLSDRELRGLFRKLDTGKTGKVEFDEFARMLQDDTAGAPAFDITVTPAPACEGGEDAALASESGELQQVRTKLAALDRDGNCILTFKEMSSLLRMGDPDLSDRELQGLFRKMDTSKSGEVDFNEFARMLVGDSAGPPTCDAADTQPPMLTLAKLKELRVKFTASDDTGKPILSLSSMSSLLRQGNPDLLDRDLRGIFQKLDTNGTGKIQFDQLLDFLVSAPLQHTKNE